MEMVERESGRKVKALRRDNGGEYIAMEDFFEQGASGSNLL